MATVSFEMAGMYFEYDEEKNQKNLKKHGIDFKTAARIFFDYDRIEYYDETHSDDEDRYNTIGDTSAANIFVDLSVIGTPFSTNNLDDVLFVVYTERIQTALNGEKVYVNRLISARMATEFERGMYYGKH